jgi:ribosomal protein L11 methyltransferase
MPAVPAFGDGTHPTTRLAAGLLLRAAPAGRRILDLGCGTGVLGILALRAGAAACVFSDYDAHAVAGCQAVLQANGDGACPVLTSDLLQAIPDAPAFDGIVANLYGELQQEVLADPRLAVLLPRGFLVLSGMSAGKAPAVIAAALACGFSLVERREEGFWVAASFRR